MRRTIVCTDLDQMIDFATAFADGGWSALRDAIKQQDGVSNMAEDYDNSNRVALWKREDGAKGVYTGGGEKSDFGGEQINSAVLFTREKRKDTSPVGDLFFSVGKGKDATAYHAPIFKNEKGLSGQINGWWINVFKNEKGPPIVVKFKPKDDVVQGKVDQDEDDDVPF